MIRRPPRSTLDRSSAASDVYKRQILFVVDASWSMAASERMEATKGAIFSLLIDAYQRRDQVGLIVFQRDRARVVLPPTTSVELAQRALQDLPVGGKTPLSSGLFLAWQVLENARRRDSEIRPLMILLTDGAGNVSMTGMPAMEESQRLAELFDQASMRSIVINMEHAAFDRGLAQKLADALGGICYNAVSYTHLRAHETVLDLVCRLLLEKKKQYTTNKATYLHYRSPILCQLTLDMRTSCS